MDSQFDDEEDERDYHESFADDREIDFAWECCFPNKCLMAYTDHMRSECYTVEMYEEYMKEEISR